jgi:hypothetical protein
MGRSDQGTGVIGGGGVQTTSGTFSQQGGTGVAGFGGDSAGGFANALTGDGVQGFGGAGAPGYTLHSEPTLPPTVYAAFPGGSGVIGVGGNIVKGGDNDESESPGDGDRLQLRVRDAGSRHSN